MTKTNDKTATNAKVAKDAKSDTATKEVAAKGKKGSKMYANMPKGADAGVQKKFRSKARRSIAKLSNAIITTSLAKDKKGLPTAIKTFIAHYKKEYILNDFAVESIYSGGNEDKKGDFGRALQLCKDKLAGK